MFDGIERALAAGGYVVAFWSAPSKSSRWVELEHKQSEILHPNRVLYAALDETPVPLVTWQGGVVKVFGTLNVLNCSALTTSSCGSTGSFIAIRGRTSWTNLVLVAIGLERRETDVNETIIAVIVSASVALLVGILSFLATWKQTRIMKKQFEMMMKTEASESARFEQSTKREFDTVGELATRQRERQSARCAFWQTARHRASRPGEAYWSPAQ